MARRLRFISNSSNYYTIYLVSSVFLLFMSANPIWAKKGGAIKDAVPKLDDPRRPFAAPIALAYRPTTTETAEGVSMPIFRKDVKPVQYRHDTGQLHFEKRDISNDSMSAGIFTKVVSTFTCGGLPCYTPFEPTVAASADNVFLTGNTLAMTSGSMGASWSYVDPAATHPCSSASLCTMVVLTLLILQLFVATKTLYLLQQSTGSSGIARV